MSEDLRSTLEAAIEQHTEPVPEPAAEPAPEAKAPPEPAAAAESAPADPTAATTARARDEKGRFAPKAADAAVAKAGEAAEPTLPPATPPPAPPEAWKPPQAWKPTAREAFSKLPADLQAVLGPEFVRREQEIARTMQETADARKFRDEFRETFRPFEPFMAAAGHTPMESLRSLAQTAAALQTAPPAQKAQIVAQIIQGYGVPIDALDAVLAGQAPRAQAVVDPNQIAQQVEQRLRAQLEAQRTQVMGQKAAHDIEAFAKGREFFDDVREEMADLIAAKAQRGVELSLEQAYDLACAVHPEIAAVLAQRKAAEAAKAHIASTQRSKAAGSSIKAIPAEPVTRNARPRSLREEIEAQVAAVGRT